MTPDADPQAPLRASKTFDRTEEDIGNSVLLEHVNLRVPDQQTATLFYVTGIGLTREPYVVTGLENMWVNIGPNQLHLGPHGEPQVLRGRIGLVTPDRDRLLRRLASVRDRLEGTRFAFDEHDRHVEVTCPWGNCFRCHEPDVERFGRIMLGIPYVELDVPIGSADGIVRFYQQALHVEAAVIEEADALTAQVRIGRWQQLVFRESERPAQAYDGHHIQIYLNDFSGPHRWLLDRGLISEESGQYQYRFTDIIDPNDGRRLFVIEHEVRSMTHPLFGRPLVNRNPDQSNRDYVPGHDSLNWRMPRDESA